MQSVSEEHIGKRLDAVLAGMFPEYSRARLSKWIKDGTVLVDGQVLRPRYLVKGGEEVALQKQEVAPQDLEWTAEPIELEIVYQDSALLVINKPAGLVVHPGAGNWQGTLVNGLLNFDPSLSALPRAGVVHRLDKETTGLLVIARTLQAHTSLVRQLEARTVKREYYAVVNGVLTAGGTIDEPIGRHKVKRKSMAVIEGGREAITHYRIAERFRAHTGVRVMLETGRTHQIRVHMAHNKIPLVGDKTYGGRFRLPPKCSEEFKTSLHEFKRQALHARKLGLIHPETQEEMSWQVPFPDDIKHLVLAMRLDREEHA